MKKARRISRAYFKEKETARYTLAMVSLLHAEFGHRSVPLWCDECVPIFPDPVSNGNGSVNALALLFPL